MTGTGSKSDTPLAHGNSRPVLFELVSYKGEIFGPYTSLEEAASAAEMKWPGQVQDPDRTGAGWDVQVAGIKD